MSRIILCTGLLLFAVSAAVGQSAVIAGGTELFATSSVALSTETLEVNGDANFVLSADVSGPNGVVAKGSELLGRIVDVKKMDAAASDSRIVLLFDFLKVGDEFYSIKAVLVSVDGSPSGLKFGESEQFPGGTTMSLKGSNISIAEGTVFKVKVLEDVVPD